MESYRFPPEHQPLGNLAVDEDGNQVLLAEPSPTKAIGKNPDGTETLRPRSRLGAYSAPLVAARPERDMSSRLVMRLAVKGILESLVCYQTDTRARSDDAPYGVRAFALQRIFLSWPKPTEEADPSPSIMVRVNGPVSYSDKQRSPRFIEGTHGRWAPNTVLRKVARASGQVQIVAWCADLEQGEALESAIERAFLAETSEDLVGRRIIVPQYYDQQARLTLVDTDDPADETLARENRWPIVATVQVEIDRVILVQAPPMMATAIGGDIGGEITIT